MFVAIVSLLVLIAVSLIVTRLAAMALTLTGMSHEMARFQARSALAGVGFTTRESESVVNHPVRRRIIMLLMLTGSIGAPAVIAALVVSTVTTVQTEHWWEPLGLLVAGISLLLLIARSSWMEKRLNRILEWALRRWTDLNVRDYISLLRLSNGYAVTELLVEPGDWLDGLTIREAALSQEGVLVLAIVRKGGTFVGAPSASDVMEAEDELVLYGLVERLRELDQRKAPSGEAAHARAVAEHAAREQHSVDDPESVG